MHILNKKELNKKKKAVLTAFFNAKIFSTFFQKIIHFSKIYAIIRMLLKIEYGNTATIRIILPFNKEVFGLSSIFPKGSIITRMLSVCVFLFYKEKQKKETKKCYMIQLNEEIQGKIIFLKQRKNVITIKILQEDQKNERMDRGKLVRDSCRDRGGSIRCSLDKGKEDDQREETSSG